RATRLVAASAATVSTPGTSRRRAVTSLTQRRHPMPSILRFSCPTELSPALRFSLHGPFGLFPCAVRAPWRREADQRTQPGRWGGRGGIRLVSRASAANTRPRRPVGGLRAAFCFLCDVDLGFGASRPHGRTRMIVFPLRRSVELSVAIAWSSEAVV